MKLEPDDLLVQSLTLIYFCATLWFGVSTPLIPVRQFARQQVGIVIGIVLIACAMGWCYLFFAVLHAQISTLYGPLLYEVLLILAVAITYLPIKPWRKRSRRSGSRALRVARAE